MMNFVSGDHDWARTNDFFHVKEVLYQLSYAIIEQNTRCFAG